LVFSVFLLDFGIVPTVWYFGNAQTCAVLFCFSIRFWNCSDSVVFWDCSDSVVFLDCSDSVVFWDCSDSGYFGIAPTVWHVSFVFSLLH
jgi:hypothetical protein